MSFDDTDNDCKNNIVRAQLRSSFVASEYITLHNYSYRHFVTNCIVRRHLTNNNTQHNNKDAKSSISIVATLCYVVEMKVYHCDRSRYVPTTIECIVDSHMSVIVRVGGALPSGQYCSSN